MTYLTGHTGAWQCGSCDNAVPVSIDAKVGGTGPSGKPVYVSVFVKCRWCDVVIEAKTLEVFDE